MTAVAVVDVVWVVVSVATVEDTSKVSVCVVVLAARLVVDVMMVLPVEVVSSLKTR